MSKKPLTTSETENQDSTPAQFRSEDEQLRELDNFVSAKIKESEVQATQESERPPPDVNAETPVTDDPSPDTKEFMQLADFISKQRSKKLAKPDPATAVRNLKLNKYQSIKTQEFEHQAKQKGLQINKAA